MTWWGWLLFWVGFWCLALAHLGRKIWRLWPHARDFARTVGEATQRAHDARGAATAGRGERVGGEHSKALIRSDTADLAWDRSAGHWREQLRRNRSRHRELRLDDHARVWASWRRRLD